jgi:cell division protein FtsI/penicillin-binding protein 2
MVGKRRPAIAGLAGLVVLAALTSCSSDSDAAASSLKTFLSDWHSGHLDRASYAGASGAAVAKAYASVAGDLATRHPTLRAGDVKVSGSTATAPVTVSWPLGTTTWKYSTTVALAKSSGSWKVAWTAKTVHPKLAASTRLTVADQQAARASILDGAGQPIVSEQPVVYVGVEPDHVKDPAGLAKQLGTALGTDLTGLPNQLKSAQPDGFVPVITLRQADYEKVKPQIYNLPGTVFQTGTLPLAPTRTFARALLGSVGPVTKETIDASKGRYQAGDTAGLSGLQARYDARMAGTIGAKVQVTGSGVDPVTVYDAKPTAGQPVKLTLDQKTQNAADAALATQTKLRTALVAMRISDGSVLAVANGPDGGTDDLALTASVPPGSTFKVVTTLAYLGLGVTPTTTVNCPETATVGGRQFHNENNFQLGDVPFSTDFAQSCNTAFVGLSSKLAADTLTKTADQLGVGAKWQLGTDVNTGSVPSADAPVDRAAAAFGQGRTTVSPIVLAAISAAVARGHWSQPKLVTDPAPGQAAPDGPALNTTYDSQLKQLMRGVVTDGTATVLANVPGGAVYGKTGTAEYGSNNPPNSHSWFTGWQGDIAFACFVEDGGTNEQAVAAPLVAKFLTNLNG